MKSCLLVISFLALIAILAIFAAAQTQPASQPSTRPAPLDIALQYSATADASTVIQHAVNQIIANGTGGTLALSPGTWSLETAITITDSSQVITLEGNGASLIMQADAPHFGPGSAIWLQNDSNVTIQDFRFNGNRAARGFDGSTHTILLNWSNKVNINSCSFVGATGDDIFLWSGLNSPMPTCQSINVINCSFDSPGRNCISVVNAKLVTIDYCSFANATLNDPKAALDLEPNPQDPAGCISDCEIERCTFNNCFHSVYAQNIGVTSPAGLTFISNTIYGGNYGVETQWANGLIAHNVFSGVAVFPIVTGSYPVGTGSRIWGNQYINCPPNALSTTDVVSP